MFGSPYTEQIARGTVPTFSHSDLTWVDQPLWLESDTPKMLMARLIVTPLPLEAHSVLLGATISWWSLSAL